jgi:hypothetical protein
MSVMMLKHRVMDPKMRDDISEALAYTQEPEAGSPGQPHRVGPAYMHNYYPAGLKERTVGPNSRQLVPVTRYYPMLKPKVIVDFEPAPPDQFWEAEKRQYCIEHGIVYVPIWLGDKMTEDEFRARVASARQTMEHGLSVLNENRALASITIEDWIQSPELMAAMDRHALRLLSAEEKESGKCFRGVAKHAVLRRIKQQLVDELRRGMKNGSIVDPLDRYREPAHATE